MSRFAMLPAALLLLHRERLRSSRPGEAGKAAGSTASERT